MRHPRAARWCTALLLSAAAAMAARAQAVVSGVVRDSVSGRPFAGATIELVPAAAPWLPGYTARSDSSGRFSIAEVSAGKYLFGFLHPRLDSLGMDQVTRTIDVKPMQQRVTADLALPSARTLAGMLCNTRRDNVGVLLGRVYDARDGRAVPRGTVLVRWGELSVGDSGVRNDAAQRTATVHEDGRFIACDVPTDAPLLVQAVAGNLADPAWVVPTHHERGDRAGVHLRPAAAAPRPVCRRAAARLQRRLQRRLHHDGATAARLGATGGAHPR